MIQTVQERRAGYAQLGINEWVVKQHSSSELNKNDLTIEQQQANETFATQFPLTANKDASKGSVDEKLLLSLFNGKPLLPEYNKTRKEYFFPMSVDEVWLIFFADEPIYGLNKAIEELGDKIDLTENWHAPRKPTFQGLPFLQERL